MKPERIAKIVLHVVLASTIAAVGITLIRISEAGTNNLWVIGSLMVLGTVAYLVCLAYPFLPDTEKEMFNDVGRSFSDAWMICSNALRVLSKIASVASCLALAFFMLIWTLAGLYSFLTAPIGFKGGHESGALEGVADAFWLPAIGVLVVSSLIYLLTRRSRWPPTNRSTPRG
jgi:hypothetical protein